MRTILRNKIITLIIRCQLPIRDIPTLCHRDRILLKIIRTIVQMIKIHTIGTITTITENTIPESSIIIKANKDMAINRSSHILRRQQATIRLKDTLISRRTTCSQTSSPRIILRGTAAVRRLDLTSGRIKIKETITRHPGCFHGRIIPIRISSAIITRQI